MLGRPLDLTPLDSTWGCLGNHDMSTFVLVHGAWHGAWCWHKLTPELEALGHTVHAFDLPGHGEASSRSSRVRLKDYVAKILGVLDGIEERVVLVGHSMGGMPISAVAERCPERIDALVYLTAFLPRSGESLFDIEGRNPHPTVPPSIVPADDELTATVREDKIEELFYHDCSEEDIAFARRHLTPQALAPLNASVEISEEKYGRVRRAYIRCSEDRAISLEFQQHMIDLSPCQEVMTLHTSHSPFFSAPRKLAEVLSRL